MKKQFQTLILKLGGSAHYSGKTLTMYVRHLETLPQSVDDLMGKCPFKIVFDMSGTPGM